MNEIFGVLLLAFFAYNPVLIRAAGLDSAERMSRDARRVPVAGAVIVCSAFVSHILTFSVLTYFLPLLGIAPTTATDGTVAVFATLGVTLAMEYASKRWLPQVRDILGGSIFTFGYNSASVGIVLLSRTAGSNFGKSLVYCLAFSASVVIMYFLINFWRSHLKEHRLPKTMRGAPILFLLLGLVAMVLEGYAGVSLPG